MGYTGKMTLLDGTPVVDKTEAAQQEAKDRLRMIGYSPARKGKSNEVKVDIPAVTSSGASIATGSTSIESELQNRSELIEQGNRSQSLIPPRSPDGTRAIEGRSRPPRTQEDWVKWALNSADIHIPPSPSSRTSASAGNNSTVAMTSVDGIASVHEKRKASVSSTWVEPPSEDESDNSAIAGEIEMKTWRDFAFAPDMNDEEGDSDYVPENDFPEDDVDDDDGYAREAVTARLQKGTKDFYELESVSTQGIEEDPDTMSYEAGKSKTAEAIANAAGGSTYIDPRASVRSSVSSLGDLPDTVRSAWCDPAEETTANE